MNSPYKRKIKKNYKKKSFHIYSFLILTSNPQFTLRSNLRNRNNKQLGENNNNQMQKNNGTLTVTINHFTTSQK